MTQIQLPRPDDERTFQNALTEFISAAADNGIPVDRVWLCEDDTKAWEVEVVPLALD